MLLKCIILLINNVFNILLLSKSFMIFINFYQ